MTGDVADDVRVADVMTRDVYVLKPGQSLPLAESMMGLLRVRHVPVVDDDEHVVGLVTHRDLLAAQISSLAPLTDDERSTLQLSVPVSRVMRPHVWTIRSRALALTAARIMREHRFGCLPVVDDGRLVGIVTEADLLTLLTASIELARPVTPPTVEHAMTPAPTTIGPTTTIAEARRIMTTFGVHHLPVVQDGSLSMVTDRDLRVAEAIFDRTNQASAAHVVHVLGEGRAHRVEPRAALHSVMAEMVRSHLDAVLVVDGDRLLGILTAMDACRLLADHLRREHTRNGLAAAPG